MFDELGDLVVAFGGDGDDAAAAGGDLLNVAEGLFVLEDAGGVVGVFGGDADYGEGLVDEGVGAVLHLAGGVAFGVDVGDLLELEGAFEGDGVVDAAAEEEEVVGGVEDFGELFALGVEGEAGRVRRSTKGCGGAVCGMRSVTAASVRAATPSDMPAVAGEVEGEHGFELGGDSGELVDEVEGFGVGDGAADLARGGGRG